MRRKITDHEVTEMMFRYGGGFIRALAQTARCADEVNLAALKAAFPNYWREYTEIADRQLNGQPS